MAVIGAAVDRATKQVVDAVAQSETHIEIAYIRQKDSYLMERAIQHDCDR